MQTFLVADIGGTHARCAHAVAGPADRTFALVQIHIYACRDFADIDEMLARYRQDTGGTLPTHGCLAVAGPVDGDRITLTNNDWNFSTEQLRRRFGFDTLAVINDLEAVAQSTGHVDSRDLIRLRKGKAHARAPRVVVSPGTGLGVAGIVFIGDRWQPIASEAGHAGFAPAGEKESRILDVLRNKHGYVSWENVLSGPGLVQLYEVLAILSGRQIERRGPQEITRRARVDGDPLCIETVETFCAVLADFASYAALSFCAVGGVYLAGSICRSLQPWLVGEAFLERFDHHGPMAELLGGMPIELMSLEHPGLIGAAASLHRRQADSRVGAVRLTQPETAQ